MSLETFIATLRVQFLANDEVEAQIVADQMASDLNSDLIADDGERAILTQVASTEVGVTYEEMLVNFRATRNALIRTRYKPAFDLARELQQIIQALENGDLKLIQPFDYGKFQDIAEAIILHLENPQ